MDVTALIALFGQQGFGYVLFLLAVVVLGWREARHDKRMTEKEAFIIQMLERRADEAIIREKAFEASQNRSLEAIKEGNAKTEQILNSAAVLVKGMDQLLFRGNNNGR